MTTPTKNWEDGLRTGAYHNPGTMKFKKRGRPKRKGDPNYGIRRDRMERRRGRG